MSKINKTKKVLEHLKEHGNITSLEAIELFGATRLSAIIFNLRKQGYSIETTYVPFKDRYGVETKFGKYILNKV